MPDGEKDFSVSSIEEIRLECYYRLNKQYQLAHTLFHVIKNILDSQF